MDSLIDKIWSLLWGAINDSKKLEVASYLVLQAQNDREQWNLRPHTKDGSRDVERLNNRGTYYCEAKYRTSEKLALEAVGDDISVAILNRIDKLFITTNAEIRQDLLSYVEKFNQSDVTIKKLTIELIDGAKFQQIIILENPNHLYSYLDKIAVTGYQGKDIVKKALDARLSYQEVGRGIIDRLCQIKASYQNIFICNPKLNRLNEVIDFIKISDFFITNFAYIYNKEYSYWPLNNVKIVIGTEFVCQVSIKNLFADAINYRIEIISDVGIHIFTPHSIKDNIVYVDGSVEAYSTVIIDIACKVYNVPTVFDIVIKPLGLKYAAKFSLDKNVFDNRLLHTPFLTTYQNILIEEFLRDADKTHNQMFVTLIRGIGGVGKTTIINMICDRIRSKNYKSYHILRFQFANIAEIVKGILVYFSNIEGLIKEAEYARIINSLLFGDDEEECKSVINLLFSNTGKKSFNLRYTRILANIVSNLLSKILKQKRVILIIEDIHLANKSSLNFISGLICNLMHTDINIILSERVDLRSGEDVDIAKFYDILDTISQKSIKKYKLDDFSVENARFLVDHYIDYNEKDREFILDKIIEIAGRNPHGITQLLLAIAASTDAFFQSNGLLYIHRHHLEALAFCPVVENRFKNTIINSALYGAIFCYLVLFKNRLPKLILPVLFSESILKELEYLQEYRFIFIDTMTIRFDHETLYRTFSESMRQYLTNDEIEHYAIVASRKIDEYPIDIQISILYYCPDRYDQQFNNLCIQYIDNLIDEEDKKGAIEYCNLFLKKHADKIDVDTLLLCASVKVKKYSISKEYSDINAVIQHSLDLEKELDSYCLANYRERIDSIKCQLYANLGSAYQQIPNARHSLLYLNRVGQMLNEHDSNLCVIYNRLGVSYRMLHEMDLAISFLIKSLRLAFCYQNHYLIYHNYFDISSCFMALGNIEAGRKYMYKAANVDFTKFGNRQQVGYIDCQNVLYHHQVLFDNIHDVNAIDSLMIQARDNNFTWHYCNIANLRGIIEMKKFRFLQAIDFFKGLLSYCQVYTRSTKQKVYILNNLLVALYFQNEASVVPEYVNELVDIVQQELAVFEYGEMIPSRLLMALLNLQTWNYFDFSKINHLSYKLTRVEEYCKLKYSGKYLYIIYR